MIRKRRSRAWWGLGVVSTVLIAAIWSLGIVDTAPACGDDAWSLGEGVCAPLTCSPVEYNGNVRDKFNFVVAFHAVPDETIAAKGYDLARASFYRSQYVDRMGENEFGWAGRSVEELTPGERVGLFELEPFTSNVQKFNVFYIRRNTPQPEDKGFFVEQCPFLAELSPATDYLPVVLMQEGSTRADDTVFTLANAPIFFNQRVGALFGLAYEGSDWLLRTQQASPVGEAEQLANCDYGHPASDADYTTGAGYCSVWCEGVNAEYEVYREARGVFESCVQRLAPGLDLSTWIDFCTHRLVFDKYTQWHKRLPPILGDDGWIDSTSQEDACHHVAQVVGTAPDPVPLRVTYTRHRFCDQGSLFNVGDVDLGKACLPGTGCFPGCHGRADAFRPTRFSVMQTTHRLDASADLAALTPAFGAFENRLLRERFDSLGLK